MSTRLAVVDVAELESAIERAVAAALARPAAAPSEWLTSAEAAKLLGVSTKTLGASERPCFPRQSGARDARSDAEPRQCHA